MIDWTIDINSLLLLIIAAFCGIYGVGRWVRGQETTPLSLVQRMDRLESTQTETDEKANQILHNIGEWFRQGDDAYVSRKEWDQFLERFSSLEDRYNGSHNGGKHR